MQADTEGDGAMEAEEDNTFLYVCFFTLAAAVQSVFIRWQLFYSAITGDMKHRTTVIVMRDVLYGDR